VKLKKTGRRMKLYLNSEKDQSLVTWTKKDYLLEAAKRLGLDFIKDIKDDPGPHGYVLNIQPCEIHKGSRWTGLWHIDVLLDSDFPDHYGQVDTVFVASSRGVRPIKNQIVMFQACDPAFHRPEAKKTHDLVFCGSRGPATIYTERDRVFTLLEKKYDCVTVPDRNPPETYIDIISTSRVQLVQSGTTKDNEWGMCAQRFFECLAIGPVLCDWTPDLDLLGLVEGRDYLAYRDDKELISNMDRLLKSKKLRDRIAKSGRQQALHLHTYEHRLVSILNTINEYTLCTA